MAVIVNLTDLGIARVSEGAWTSDVHDLADFLTAHVHVAITGSDPDPDLTIARAAVRLTGGSILQRRPPFVPSNGIP